MLSLLHIHKITRVYVLVYKNFCQMRMLCRLISGIFTLSMEFSIRNSMQKVFYSLGFNKSSN